MLLLFSIRVAERPPVCVFSFYFGFEGGTLALILLVPDHYSSF